MAVSTGVILGGCTGVAPAVLSPPTDRGLGPLAGKTPAAAPLSRGLGLGFGLGLGLGLGVAAVLRPPRGLGPASSPAGLGLGLGLGEAPGAPVTPTTPTTPTLTAPEVLLVAVALGAVLLLPIRSPAVTEGVPGPSGLVPGGSVPGVVVLVLTGRGGVLPGVPGLGPDRRLPAVLLAVMLLLLLLAAPGAVAGFVPLGSSRFMMLDVVAEAAAAPPGSAVALLLLLLLAAAPGPAPAARPGPGMMMLAASLGGPDADAGVLQGPWEAISTP